MPAKSRKTPELDYQLSYKEVVALMQLLKIGVKKQQLRMDHVKMFQLIFTHPNVKNAKICQIN